MPNETQNAIEWALKQIVLTDLGGMQVTKETPIYLVDKVREYFNTNNISYSSFSYDDLKPYL